MAKRKYTMRRRGKGTDRKALEADENKMIEFLAKGFSIDNISRAMGVKPTTLEGIKRRLFVDHHLTSAAHLVSWAYQRGILKLESTS